MQSFKIQNISDCEDSSDIDIWDEEDDEPWEQIQVEEQIQDIYPIYQNILSKQRKRRKPSKYSAADDFDDIFYQKSIPDPIFTEEDNVSFQEIDTVIVNVAHVDQMPKSNSSYSSTLPCILAWTNTRNSFSSEYPNVIQQYFKNRFNKISSKLRFFFSIAPSLKRFNNFSHFRQDGAISRIMFHYIGYGFPDITRDGIWCSEKRTSEYSKFPFSSLVSKLETPTCYFFDCNNAAAAIEGLKEAHEEMTESYEALNWNDWTCICATDVGEKLPDEAKLPKDFLTSCMLTPVKTALLCHVLQYFRLDIEDSSVEPPFHSLWDDNSPESIKLSILLSSLIDSIAADSLPRNIYYTYFRNSQVTFNVFKAYLLAQHLLKAYDVHPKSYPNIPDLSNHPMWKQWSVLLDTSICCFTASKPWPLMNDLFNRLSISFEFLLKNEQYEIIRPYHLILLFYSIIYDSKNDKPIILLSEYASSNCEEAPFMMASTTFILSLFDRLLAKDPKSPIFAPLCFLIIYVLYYSPSSISEIRSDLDLSKLPFLIFRKDLPMRTRVFCAAIVACLVTTFEKLQEICTSNEFISLLYEYTFENEPVLTTYLLLIFSRSFILYSPDSSIFLNGIHVNFAVYSTNDNEAERASSLFALSSLLRPFECKRNTQILLLALTVISDISSLVRFQLVLILMKFIMTFDFYSESLSPEESYNNSTFKEIENSLLGDGDYHSFLKLDKLLGNNNENPKFSYSIGAFLIKFLSKDPNEQVRTAAMSIMNIFNQQAMNPNDYSIYQQDPSQGLNDGDVILRNIIYNSIILHSKTILKKKVQKQNLISEFTVSTRKSPIKILKTNSPNFCIAALVENSVYFCLSEQKIFSYTPEYTIENIEIFCINNIIHIGISGLDGCLYIWEPISDNINYSFRVDSRFDKETSIFQTIFIDSETLYTITSNGSIVSWNLITQKLTLEWDLHLESSVIISIIFKGNAYLGCDNGNLYSFNFISNQLQSYEHTTKITKLIENEGKIYCLDENGHIDIFEENSFKQLNILIYVQSFTFIDSQTILICSKENKAYYYYLNENQIKEITNISNVNYCCYLSNEKHIIFSTIDGKIIVQTMKSVK